MASSVLDDPDVRERYLGLLRVGTPKHKAAATLGLGHRMVLAYTAKNPDFAEKVADAVGEGVDPLYEKAYELALGKPCTCGGGQVEHEAGKGGNRGPVVEVHLLGCKFMPPDPGMLTFMLKALQPELFGAKVQVEVEHKVSLETVEAVLELEERLKRRQHELAGGQVLQLGAESIRELPA